MIVSFAKKNINNLLQKAIDQYIQDTIQVFQIWHNLCSELTSILAIQKQPTNRPQLNKSDRPQVNICDGKSSIWHPHPKMVYVGHVAIQVKLAI